VRPDDGETEAGQEGKIEGRARALVETLRDQVRYCKEHLDARGEVLEEHRRLLVVSSRAYPREVSVEPPASSQSRPEEAVQEYAETAPSPFSLPPAGGGTPQDDSERVPWWKKDVG
jgi:hypothetical protein